MEMIKSPGTASSGKVHLNLRAVIRDEKAEKIVIAVDKLATITPEYPDSHETAPVFAAERAPRL